MESRRHHSIVIIGGVLMGALVLAACKSVPTQAPVPVLTRPDYSALLGQLPEDADRQRLGEQAKWVTRGVYIDRSGQFKALPVATVPVGVSDGRPAVPKQPAVEVPRTTIVLPLPERPEVGHE